MKAKTAQYMLLWLPLFLAMVVFSPASQEAKALWLIPGLLLYFGALVKILLLGWRQLEAPRPKMNIAMLFFPILGFYGAYRVLYAYPHAYSLYTKRHGLRLQPINPWPYRLFGILCSTYVGLLLVPLLGPLLYPLLILPLLKAQEHLSRATRKKGSEYYRERSEQQQKKQKEQQKQEQQRKQKSSFDGIDFYKIYEGPWQELRLPPSAGNDAIKQAYRTRMGRLHPDRIQSLELDEDFLKLATIKAQHLNRAYEEVRRERRF